MNTLPKELHSYILKYTGYMTKTMMYYTCKFWQLLITSDNIMYKVNVCNSAAISGYLSIFQWGMFNECRINHCTFNNAIEGGNMEIINILLNLGYNYDTRSCEFAARGGRLDILKWLRAQGAPWENYIYVCAATFGHLHIIEYMYANGCEWNKRATLYAVRYKYLHILKWVYEHNCLIHEDVCKIAINDNNTEILNWLHSEKFD